MIDDVTTQPVVLKQWEPATDDKTLFTGRHWWLAQRCLSRV